MNHKAVFSKLENSSFRNSFHLGEKEKSYILEHGYDDIRIQAAKIIKERLAPVSIQNDGRQTPLRGNPVFIAQHAVGCCCRGCLEKWHHIPHDKELSALEQEYIVDIIMEWIECEMNL